VLFVVVSLLTQSGKEQVTEGFLGTAVGGSPRA